MKGYKLVRTFHLFLFLLLLYACGKGGVPAVPEEKTAETTVMVEPGPLEGLKLYLGYCFVCHGQKGDGNGPYAEKLSAKPADFTDSTYFRAKADSELYDFISKGGIAHGKSMHMKPFGFQMTPDEIESSIASIRVLKVQISTGRRSIRTPVSCVMVRKVPETAESRRCWVSKYGR